MAGKDMANRVMHDIPELVERLRVERAKQVDYLVPSGDLEMLQTDTGELRMRDARRVETFGLLEQAHGQVAGKLDIPKRYYDRMLAGSQGDKSLLCENINHWMLAAGAKKRFVRTVDGTVRAFLGSRYRPISHLDLVTSAVQVMTGMEAGDQDKPWAKGARCFAWALDPMNLSCSFVQPCIQVDLNNLDAGPKLVDPQDMPQGGAHSWLTGGPGTVYPCIRIRNSETGHGGLTVTAGIYERICNNTAHIGQEMAVVHVGRELEQGDIWSPDTQRRMNEVIFSQTRDMVRNAFNPEKLLGWVKRWKGLEVQDIPGGAREAAAQVVELVGLTEGVRDDILEAYATMTQARGNMFDFQRAVTAAAHTHREQDARTAESLEDFGGVLIERGARALAGKA